MDKSAMYVAKLERDGHCLCIKALIISDLPSLVQESSLVIMLHYDLNHPYPGICPSGGKLRAMV